VQSKARRRQRSFIIALGGLLLITGLVAVIAVAQWLSAQAEKARAVRGEKSAHEREIQVRKTSSHADFDRAEELVAAQRRQQALAFLARAVRSDPGNYAAGRRILFLLTQHPWFVPVAHDEFSAIGNRVTWCRSKKPDLSKRAAAKIKNFPHAPIKRNLISLSPDGKMIAFCSDQIYVLDAEDGKVLAQHKSNGDEHLQMLGFSPDSSCLITVGGTTSEYGNSGSVMIFDLVGEAGSSKEFHFGEVVSGPEFSPDSALFLTQCAGSNTQLWGIDGENLATFPVDGDFYFSADTLHIKIGDTFWIQASRQPLVKIQGDDPSTWLIFLNVKMK
jgi:hypothetical protein